MRAAPVRTDFRLEPGAQLGPFLLEHRIAQASASSLYLARDADGGRVVLRIVQPNAATSPARARLKREARALASVEHHGVVRLQAVGEDEGMPWVGWAYVRGLDLERILAERGPLPFEVAVRHAIQIAESLVAAHGAGVAHREVEPSNVLLVPEGRIVLVDFGIVPRVLETRDASESTGVHECREATSAYAAPEQIEHGLADERSDVWALGCVLYEMLVGEPPFGRGGPATADAILRDEPTFPGSVPATTAHIISACLRKNSFARIATARELLVLLRDALDDRRSDTNASAEPRSGLPSTRQAFPPSGTIPPPPRVPSLVLPMISRFTTLSTSDTSKRPPPSATRAKAAKGRIKGTALRAGLAWFADLYGPPGLARIVELASPELKGMLRSKDTVFGLIASGWYDTRLVGELFELLECVASPSNRVSFGSSVGDAIARDNVGGVHRALFRLVSSPPLLEANAQRVWRTYVDEGTLSVRLRGEGEFEARVRGWSHHHPSVCRTLRAMLESSLRAVGYEALILERTHCVGLGDTQCAFDGRWTA